MKEYIISYWYPTTNTHRITGKNWYTRIYYAFVETTETITTHERMFFTIHGFQHEIMSEFFQNATRSFIYAHHPNAYGLQISESYKPSEYVSTNGSIPPNTNYMRYSDEQ